MRARLCFRSRRARLTTLVAIATAASTLAPAIATSQVDEVRVRLSGYNQHGFGFQSRASVVDALPLMGNIAGSERLGVFQALGRLGVRQNDRVRHSLDLAVDIVTSASADALDAVSSASRVNEAATIEGRTFVDVTDNDHLTFNLGYHIEETLKSGHGNISYVRDLAQDNATIGASFGLVVDFFDPITPYGFDLGFVRRATVNANLGASQILSPTTIAYLAYGLTYQVGTLQQTWNAVPLDNFDRAAELFPRTRLRHAATLTLAQRIPITRTTLRGSYRLYRDDFDVTAHTFALTAFQELGERVVLELGYRLHDQTAVSFWTQEAPSDVVTRGAFRSADSDLSAFRAHQASIGLRFVLSGNGEARGEESVDVRYLRYARSTGLHVDLFSIGYAREF